MERSKLCSLRLVIPLLDSLAQRYLQILIFSMNVFFPVSRDDLKLVLPLDTSYHLQEYQSFRIGSDGNLQGVGLFINSEPRTGHLVSDQTYLETLFNTNFSFS